MLGKGGMGEVYRAEDLTLGQEVALKFLPRAIAEDPTFLERFHNEVRIARQVSHPHVCRVYDIFQGDGQLFLSMEYVDGEDLGSLLKRIGRLPGDKALEFSRKICAGLAAAHDRGVLHRDLKPGNILIDGRGQPLLTDFGLAAMAGEVEDIRSGTPQYQAPEQRAGKEVTARSDIYSLGLLLYEMFTGRQAFTGNTLAELDAQQKLGTVTSVTSIARDVDPAVEAVIARCLDPDPAKRPASAIAVSAALPGGDPLAAALAAGETPSPELVAAAGTAGIPLKVAVACMLAIFVALVANLFLASKSSLMSRVPLDLPADVLKLKAKEFALAAGYTDRPADTISGFFTNEPMLRYLNDKFSRADRDIMLAAGTPVAIGLWYRQSPRPLVPVSAGNAVTMADPPGNQLSNMVSVILDSKGRLFSFGAAPPQVDDGKDAPKPVDWGMFLKAAGLDEAALTPVAPARIASVAFDSRVAWTGTMEGAPKIPLRIEAASWKGKAVYFGIIGPWDRPTRMFAPTVTLTQTILQWFYVSLFLLVVLGSSVLAYRNWRIGRGDLNGALRLAFGITALQIVSWLFGGARVLSASMLSHFVTAAGIGLFQGLALGLAYLALEPFVRRRWPHALVSWARLFSGKFHDPLVAGHALIGITIGVVWSLVFEAESLTAEAYGALPAFSWVGTLSGVRSITSNVLDVITQALSIAMGSLFLLFLARLVMRRDVLACGFFVLITTAFAVLSSANPWVDVGFSLVQYTFFTWILLRVGLLPTVLAIIVSSYLPTMTMTTDWSAWYATPTIFATLIALAGGLIAFRWATHGKRLLGDFLDG